MCCTGAEAAEPGCRRVSCYDPRHKAAPHTAGGIILPDSPNSLIERGHKEKGRQILEKIRGTNEVDAGAWSAAVKQRGRLGQLLHHAAAA